MIVKMSKVEIAGPRELLAEALSLVRRKGDVHIEPSTAGFIDSDHKKEIHALLPDEKTLFEKIFLEQLESKLIKLFDCLPQLQTRESYLSPRPIIDTVSKTLNKHLARCRELSRKKDALKSRLSEMEVFRIFLQAVSSLADELRQTPDIDYIGLTIKDEKSIDVLKKNIDCLDDASCELVTVPAEDGSIVGLIVATKDISEKIRQILSDRQIPEFNMPDSLKNLPFVERIDFLKKQMHDDESSLVSINQELTEFTQRWGPVYRNALDWVQEQLSIIQASGLSFETSMCFFIYGWIPTAKVQELDTALHENFNGRVVLNEIEIRSEDLERIPVILKNSVYFEPFENFTRLLPLPSYTSFDPTPFIGLFFPLFFGLILGDAGYGFILLVLSVILARMDIKSRLLKDAIHILKICSLYTILFGLLYGEVLGNLGHRIFGIAPLLIDRHKSILPMLIFALAVGLAHVTLGLILGVISALRRKTKKEAFAKLIDIVLIFSLVVLIVSFFGFFPELLTKPLIILILVFCPLLLFTGGLLAPLELLKSIGNIISYARIMAIGLTSVMLANIANQLSGLTGDIILGLLVGGIIHLISIVIGVFSSTIHSLRLHYVEFFDKFIDLGGRKYDPFSKKKHNNWSNVADKKKNDFHQA
ncbi:MAG: ATPase [Proteobacteria bacterium]|nr:ATPase [Pseudomonadota bacterium]